MEQRHEEEEEEEEKRTKKIPRQWIESSMGTAQNSLELFSKLITTDSQSAVEENYSALTSGKFFKGNVT